MYSRALLRNTEVVALGLPDFMVVIFEVMAECRRWGASVFEYPPHLGSIDIPKAYPCYFPGCGRDKEIYPNSVRNLQPMNCVCGLLFKCRR